MIGVVADVGDASRESVLRVASGKISRGRLCPAPTAGGNIDSAQDLCIVASKFDPAHLEFALITRCCLDELKRVVATVETRVRMSFLVQFTN